MASASVLTPSAHGQSFYPVDHFRKPTSSTSSYLGNSAPQFKAYQPTELKTVPYKNDPYDLMTQQAIPPGAAGATKTSSATHAKLHKKVTLKTSRRGSKVEEQYQQADPSFSRTKTPPTPPSIAQFEYIPPQPQPQKSPTKQARLLIKQNLRKLSHAPEDVGNGAIDLSKTAEENEKRSGLGLTTGGLLKNSRSADALSSAAGPRSHLRSYSQVSQLSTVSSPYQPTAPFVPPSQAHNIYTPTTTYSGFDSPMFGSEYSPVKYGIPEGTVSRSRGATVDSFNSGEKRSNRIQSSRSSTRLGSQTNLSTSGFTRPRRSSTHQSVDTMGATQNRSRSSFDRAFTFLPRKADKDEPVDPVARAASIAAARQAFDDRQEAKARKYEEKEAKAAERQLRKQSKADEKEDRRRRKSTGATRPGKDSLFRQTSQGSVTPEMVNQNAGSGFERFPEMSERQAEKPEFATSGDYADIRPSTSQSANRPGLSSSEDDGFGEEKQHVPPVSRKRAAKSRYFRFLSWLKTKILNLGRK